MTKLTRTVTENKTKDDSLRVPCKTCNSITNHIVVVSIDEDISEIISEEFSLDCVDNYQIIKCQGCDVKSFRHLNWFSENDCLESDGYTERLYPRRDISSLSAKELWNTPQPLRRIYRESIESFNSECFTLCAAGLRAIVEGICTNQSVNNGLITICEKDGSKKEKRVKTLEGKISGLYEKGVLTKQSSETLHQHRFLGNDALHQLEFPSKAELKLAIEIIEHTLEQLYEIPEKVQELSGKLVLRKGIANK